MQSIRNETEMAVNASENIRMHRNGWQCKIHLFCTKSRCPSILTTGEGQVLMILTWTYHGTPQSRCWRPWIKDLPLERSKVKMAGNGDGGQNRDNDGMDSIASSAPRNVSRALKVKNTHWDMITHCGWCGWCEDSTVSCYVVTYLHLFICHTPSHVWLSAFLQMAVIQ